MDSSNKAERVFHEQISRSEKKSIWRDKASWELLMLCVPTLLAFTLFHYVPMIGIIWENEVVDLHVYQQYRPDPELYQADHREAEAERGHIPFPGAVSSESLLRASPAMGP